MASAGVRFRKHMDNTQFESDRVGSLAKMLTGAVDASPEQQAALLTGLLEAAGLTPEQRLEILGGAFVAEAVRPYWRKQAVASRAHSALRTADEELAEAVEAIAQVLLGREATRNETRSALAELNRMLAPGTGSPAVPSAGQPRLLG